MQGDPSVPPLALISEPEDLLGGATIPNSIFRDPEVTKVKDHNKFKFKKHEPKEEDNDEEESVESFSHVPEDELLV